MKAFFSGESLQNRHLLTTTFATTITTTTKVTAIPRLQRWMIAASTVQARRQKCHGRKKWKNEGVSRDFTVHFVNQCVTFMKLDTVYSLLVVVEGVAYSNGLLELNQTGARQTTTTMGGIQPNKFLCLNVRRLARYRLNPLQRFREIIIYSLIGQPANSFMYYTYLFICLSIYLFVCFTDLFVFYYQITYSSFHWLIHKMISWFVYWSIYSLIYLILHWNHGSMVIMSMLGAS